MPLIYKLYDEFDCYIGSTTQTLKARLDTHIRNRGCYSRIILDRKKFTMELIEEVETNDRFKREQYWIDSLSTLSQRVCYFESEEARIKNIKKYKEDNREHILETKKHYYDINKQKIFERKSEKINCECGKIIARGNKARHSKTLKHLAYIDAEGQKSNQS